MRLLELLDKVSVKQRIKLVLNEESFYPIYNQIFEEWKKYDVLDMECINNELVITIFNPIIIK